MICNDHIWQTFGINWVNVCILQGKLSWVNGENISCLLGGPDWSPILKCHVFAGVKLAAVYFSWHPR